MIKAFYSSTKSKNPFNNKAASMQHKVKLKTKKYNVYNYIFKKNHGQNQAIHAKYNFLRKQRYYILVLKNTFSYYSSATEISQQSQKKKQK